MELSFVLLTFVSMVVVGHTTAASLSVPSPTTTTSRKMYLFSDLHYDPYYGTSSAYGPCNTAATSPTYGAATCDTPPPLLTSFMEDIQSQAAVDSDSIFVMSGDALRHDMSTTFGNNSIAVGKSIDEVIATMIGTYITGGGNGTTASMKKKEQHGAMLQVGSRPRDLLQSTANSGSATTPNPGVVITFGNNDAIPDWLYSPIANPSAHPATGNATSVYLAHGLLAPSEAYNLSKCGFYSRQLTPTANPGDPTSPLLILSMNTNIYGSANTLVDPTTQPDPCGQFAWLESVLSEARAVNTANVLSGGKLFTGSVAVHVMGHVVPHATKEWYPQYLATYYSLINAFSDVVKVQWFAHTHMFSFIAVPEVSGPPLLQVPSITPRDGNLPSYLRASFDSDWNVREIHHRSFDMKGTWSTAAEFGQNFDSTLTSPLTTTSLNAYAQKLLGESKTSSTWLQFLALYQGGAVTIPMGNKDKLKLICKMINTDDASYEACKGDGTH